jgi:hypothetical protein
MHSSLIVFARFAFHHLECYYESVKTLDAAANISLLASPSPRTASPKKASETKQDQWLTEVTYRSCVQSQCETWETALEQLSQLFSAAQKVEYRRRRNLRECMIAIWKQQDVILHKAEASHEAPLVDWIGKPTTMEEVEQDIKASINKLARAVKGLEDLKDDSLHTHFQNAFADQDCRITNDVQPLSDRLSVLGFYEELFTTGLHSDYITHVSVIEVMQKTDQILRSNFALCIVTVDELLHLFNLPRKVDSPDEAFALILDRVNQEVQPDETIALASAEISANSAGNKIDLSMPKTASSCTISLIASSLNDQMILFNALNVQVKDIRAKSSLASKSY